MSAQYRVTFRHKPTGTLSDMYVSSADAKSTKKVDITFANRKAVAKAKKLAPKRLFGFTKMTDFAVVGVLCVG